MYNSVRRKPTVKVLAGAGLALYLIANSQHGTYKLGELEVPGFETQSLSPARFAALHAAVAPKGEGERWTEIPWMTDLNAARAASAREGKPLFMWIMDGHPLGCT
jgi:hypothetical protein